MGSLLNARTLRETVFSTTLVAALWAAPLHAQVVNLTQSQVIGLANQSLAEGQAEQAAALTDALLAQFPDNAVALLIRTNAAVLLENFEDAASFGQRAFWKADSNIARYRAARLTALAHARQENHNRAQLWLRVARQFAPNEATAAQVARDYGSVRQRNPMSVNLRFGVTPSSNINSGTSSSETNLFGLTDVDGNQLLFGLDDEAQALSGWAFSGSANVRYRLRTDKTSATFFNFGFNGETYRLSESARETAEELDADDPIKGSDFSNASLTFGLSHRFVIAPDAGITEAGVSLTRTWRAGERSRDYMTTSLSHTWSFGEGDSFRLSGFSQQQERVENGDLSLIHI